MSFEQVENLLSSHHINPKKLLGQNFMINTSLFSKLSEFAGLNCTDVVLDAGAGFGFLTRFLSNESEAVIAVEKDAQIFKVLKEQVKGLSNVTVVEGNFLEVELPKFNKVVSIPPYYISSAMITWILSRHVDCAVVIMQKEFGDKLVAEVGSEEYSWLTVLSSQHAKVEILAPVPKDMFYPSPSVDSVVLRIIPYSNKLFEVKNEILFTSLVKWLFSQRNKRLSNAILPYLKSNFNLDRREAENIARSLVYSGTRVRELLPKEFGAIADALPN
jgi:16S rRNA (adenine1518-N6/adenine1519-N6)-dimethyltransferase